MSKYTTELRFICEAEAGKTESVDLSDVEQVITDAIPHIFDFDFPIFDEQYRLPLEKKIVRHYYTREIGLETYGLWKLKLQTKLNEIMPYYNKLYESELYKYNPLYDVDMITTHSGQRTGENSNVDSRLSERNNSGTSRSKDAETNVDTSNTTSSGSRSTENSGSKTSVGKNSSNVIRQLDHEDAYSDTPQGTLVNVQNLNYLTNARKVSDEEHTTNSGNTTGASSNENKGSESNEQTVKGDSTSAINRQSEKSDEFTENTKDNSNSFGRSTSTEDYVLHVMGKSAGANYARMIKEFRDNLLNIDMDIIRELSELFMLIW